MNPYAQPSPQIYSVTKLTQEIKFLLEERYEIVWITGEVSNLRIPSSGHAYFTLKDSKAQIAAVMFRGQLRQLKFDLDDGATIVAMGRVSVYEPRGTYQIILEYIEPKGVGALQIAFQQLKHRLADEGLFEADHKKPLPFLPQKIGVITSASGAAVQDILKVIHRRFDTMAVDIYAVHVQGAQAAMEIARALETANRQNDADVLILARGGGSMEDLAAFNSETVARAIYTSDIPVVSAVGHETDFTIADFVADLRAPTPSAAAELVVPVKVEAIARCRELQGRCRQSILASIKYLASENSGLRKRLVHPKKRIQELTLRLDESRQRLSHTMKRVLDWQLGRLSNIEKIVNTLNPNRYIEQHKSEVHNLTYKLNNLILNYINSLNLSIQRQRSALDALSPLSVLRRGYSIVRALPHGDIVTTTQDVALEQNLEIILHKGALGVRVTAKNDRPLASASLKKPQK